MTSKIKVDNINKVSDDSTIIKKCGSTTTVGSGAGNTIVVCGATVTIGRCGGSVALASGATQSGFGREGSVNWQTGSIKTTTFTAVSGEGYFVDTSSGAVTANLPAGTAGAIVSFADYTRTFENNNLTISPNGSNKIGGVALNLDLKTNGQAITLVYVDGTEGWINVQNAENTGTGGGFLAATGGTVTTVDTNFKVHTFTGPGTFCVSSGGGPIGVADYLVVAGGGGGGSCGGGGGGAGGLRESHAACTSGPYTASPIASSTSLPFSPGPHAVVVGGGGGPAPQSCTGPNKGNNSSISTITSTGGGYGGNAFGNAGGPGGSGGGGGGSYPCTPAGFVAGNGNDPSTTPAQGNPGGTGAGASVRPQETGGGGGAGAVGANATPSGSANGGTGVTTNITGSPVTYAGGGGGGTWSPNGWGPGNPVGSGGAGGGGGGGRTNAPGGAQTPTLPGGAGTANTGGGGGGAGRPYASAGGTPGGGGSGIVIIRYKFQQVNYE